MVSSLPTEPLRPEDKTDKIRVGEGYKINVCGVININLKKKSSCVKSFSILLRE
jgi:hypothetical protein